MRHLACSSLFLIACSTTGGDTTIDITHDPCSGVRLIGDSSTSQRAGIDAAISLWAEHGIELGADSAPSIEIVFEEAYAAFRGLYDDERGIIIVNSTIADSRTLSIVIAHELGHAFGLEHVTDRPSLMNPANLTTPPTGSDLEAVEALWGRCD